MLFPACNQKPLGVTRRHHAGWRPNLSSSSIGLVTPVTRLKHEARRSHKPRGSRRVGMFQDFMQQSPRDGADLVPASMT